ncbi:MAG: BlaI/MecI/CopY family transcriptional regulator [Solirubrobacterales bacterium]
MAKRKTPPPPLHELEALVMEEVWRQGQATVREVLTTLNRGTRERAYTTVMTIMSRLDDKGLMTRTRQGKSDLYKPVMSRAEYLNARAEAEVKALVDEFGDIALAHFAEQVDELDGKQLRALRGLADRG